MLPTTFHRNLKNPLIFVDSGHLDEPPVIRLDNTVVYDGQNLDLVPRRHLFF